MKRGLTLIELLVVIAVVVIMLAIILPVYGRAKASANTVAMLEQQRQITLALKLYSEDYDGKYIKHGFEVGDWPTKLLNYTKSREILKNPNYTGDSSAPGSGFSINTCLTFIDFVETENPIQLAEAAPYIDGDGVYHQTFTGSVFDFYAGRIYPGAVPIGGKWLANARNGGSVVSYLDGSAKWINASATPFRGNGCHLEPNEKVLFETSMKEN